jgi:phage tail-like protein
MAEEGIVYGTSSAVFEFNGSTLKCYACTPPSGTIDIGSVKAFSQSGPVEPLSGGGHQVTFSTVSVSRYYDGTTDLWDWFQGVVEKGAVEGETKHNPTITVLKEDGSPLYMWEITGAVATGYSEGAIDAGSEALATETVEFRIETAKKSPA